MAMPVKDFRQLEKMMNMTTSENDSEALSALRMANAILKKHDYTWTSAFQRLVKVESGLPDVEEAPEEKTPNQMIVEAFEQIGNHNSEFISSLQRQFEERGSLSFKQREALLQYARGQRHRR